jgi:hypothetical protein
MVGADQRAEVTIAGFQAEQIIADPVGDDAEFLGRLLELGPMDAQQLELTLKNTGRIDHERGVLEFIQKIEQERARLVGRIRVVKLRQRAIEWGVPDSEPRGCMIRMAVFPVGSKHKFRTMAADGGRDESSVFGRVD